MSEQFIDEMGDAQDRLLRAHYSVLDMAHAMDALGMAGADQMFIAARDIREGARDAQKAMSGLINHDFEQARQSSANMLEAAIAGLIISKNDSEE